MIDWLWRRLFGDLSEPKRVIVHPLEVAERIERQAVIPDPLPPLPSDPPRPGQRGLRDIRKVNVRLLVGLVVFVTVSGVSIHFVHGWQVTRMARALYQRALAEKEQNEVQKAIGHLQIYVGYYPRDAAALADLGLLLANVANTPRQRLQAFQRLSDALRRDEHRADVRRELVRLSVELGRYRDAESILEPLDPRKATDDAQLQILAARCAEGLERYQDAERYYLNAIELQPHEFESYLRLARLLRERVRRPRAAVQIVESLVEANPDKYEAHLHKTRELLLEGEIDLAAAALAKAESLAPAEDIDVALTAASLLAARPGAHLEATSVRQRLSNLLASRPREARLYRALSMVEESVNDAEAAEDWLNRGIRQFPENPALAETRALLLIRHDRYPEASEELSRLAKITYASADVRSLHVLQQLLDDLQEENWLAAKKKLLELSKKLPGDSGFLPLIDGWLLLCYQQLGDTENELALTRRLADTNPGSGEALRSRAGALARQGNLDAALELYGRDAGDSRSQLSMAALLIAKNLRLPEVEQNWIPVERLLDQIEPKHLADVSVLRFGMLAERGRLDDAISLLEDVRSRLPDDDRWDLAEIELWQRQGNHARALSLLETLAAKSQSATVRLAQIQFWLRRGTGVPPTLLKEIEAQLPEFKPAEQARLLERLQTVYKTGNDAKGVARCLKRRAQLQPNNLKLLLEMFDQGSADGDALLVEPALEGLARIDGAEGAYAKSCRLVWESQRQAEDSKEQRRFRSELEALSEKFPKIPQVWLNLARLEEHIGDQSAALDHYRTALDAGLNDPAVVEQLVRALYDLQRYADANRVLDAYQSRTGKSERSTFSLLQTSILLDSGQAASAYSMAQSRAQRNPGDYNSLIWLGMTATAADKAAEAEKAYRDALALDPRASAAWVALVRTLARAGKAEESVATIRKAAEQITPAEAPLALAQCSEAIGDVANAGAHYNVAISLHPEDPRVLEPAARFYLRSRQHQQARSTLRALCELESSLPPKTLAWAQTELRKISSGEK